MFLFLLAFALVVRCRELYATFVADFQEEQLGIGNCVAMSELIRIHELNSYARVCLDMS